MKYLLLFILFFSSQASAEEPVSLDLELVDQFTANTLNAGEFKIGTELEYAPFPNLMIGTQVVSTLMGIPMVHLKWNFHKTDKHSLALGLAGTALDLNKFPDWVTAKKFYSKLSGEIIRPSLVWTNKISDRLRIHSYWTQGFGKLEAALSEEGRERSWREKHPGGNYATREVEVEDGGTLLTQIESLEEDNEEESLQSDKNQVKASENSSNVTRRTLELQSIFGLSTDRFQLVGEITKKDRNKVLVSCMIESMALEELTAKGIRFTIAQQWMASSFHFRLGIGVQYLDLAGTDLDGEKVSETGVSPASDLAFYWRI